MKKAAVFFLLFGLSPLPLLYFSNLNGAAIWCWIWSGLWAWFVWSKSDAFTRGLILLVGSAALAIGGRLLLKGKESDDVIDMLSQVILLIGGGVGGNFISHYLMDRKA
jgi:hypothetical protein